jgi:GrpB-like predicted nucleotidyltransferase (UPF0157 family)
MPVIVVAHDPEWADKAENEASQIKATLGDIVLAIHHIGSTSIPGIHAKPIIDFLLVVESIEALDEHSRAMEMLDYESMGEYGIPGRRYFRKSNAQGIRTHHVHSFEKDHAEVFKHLVFRDYMIAHPEAAEDYARLKKRLASAHPDDIQAYMDGKDPFIKEHLAKGMIWYSQQIPG